MSEQTPNDEIIFIEGIPGLMGANGKFHPITTDMGVEVKSNQKDPFDDVRLEATIPSGIGSAALRNELPEPPYGSSHVEKAAFLNSHLDFTREISAIQKLAQNMQFPRSQE